MIGQAPAYFIDLCTVVLPLALGVPASSDRGFLRVPFAKKNRAFSVAGPLV